MIVGGQPVARQHVGALAIPLLDRLGQLEVQAAQDRLASRLADHRLPDAIVVGLDHVRALPAAAPDQALLDQRRDAPFPCLGAEGNAGGRGQRPLGQGIAGHGDDLQAALALLGQVAHPFEDHAVQAKSIAVGAASTLPAAAIGAAEHPQADSAQVMHQLDREEGIAARLVTTAVGDAVSNRLWHLVRVEQILDQARVSSGRQRAERQRSRRSAWPRQLAADNGIARRAFGAMRDGRSRRAAWPARPVAA